MIDTKELRRLAQLATPGPDGVSLSWIKLLQDFQQGANPATISELMDRLEVAESNALEQALLNGRGASREAALMAKLEAAEKEREELRADLETERMRLAACGVVAFANTPDSAKQAREMRPEYWSASCGDVARMVDENIKLRAMIQVALVVLDEVCGNINPERGYADELETDVKRAIAALSIYNAKGE